MLKLNNYLIYYIIKNKANCIKDILMIHKSILIFFTFIKI
jgi:hypothetical protein